MLNRRKVLFGAAALMAAALPAMPVMASDSRLLADILAGVSDALTRDYIRRHYQEGRWDGRYWWYRGNRYTPATYRRFWIDDYYRHYPSPPPAHRPPPPGHRPLPPPHFDGPGGRPPPRPPHFAGGRPPGGPGPRPPQPPHGPGPRPSHAGGPRPPHFGGPGGRSPGGPGGPR